MMTEAPYIFISYRRSDSIQAVLGLYFQLRLRFGSSRVYMDVATMVPGDVWPDRLQRALDQASVVLAVVGPKWLTTADEYGRRRIDLEGDWVRLELATAIDKNRTIIPLLVGGVARIPPVLALPSPISRLAQHQAFELRDERWDDDISALARVLIDNHGFTEADASVIYPEKRVTIPPLSTKELDAALLSLPRWEPVESMIPRDYPRSRTELRRAFRFRRFDDAIRFMQELVEPLKRLDHHPRLENQWRTVIVSFTTWDIGHKITSLDINAAKEVDAVYARVQMALEISDLASI